MKTTIIGDQKVFAVEYRCPPPPPPLRGAIRIWAGGFWLGDIKESMLLGTLCEGLNSLRGARRAKSRLLFANIKEVPPFHQFHACDHWSFGEAFDDFDFVYYAVQDVEQVCWCWEAREALEARYPDYPAGVHWASVPFKTYDAVLGDLLNALHVPDDVSPGVKWAYLPKPERHG